MGPGTIPHPVRRTWTMEVRPHPDGSVLVCPWCDRIPIGPGTAAIRATIVAHLAQHAREEQLARHLRTCQCGEQGCRWHGRHRGCDGPILLLLARDQLGRNWRLADTCRSCASVTAHAAAVTEPAVYEAARGTHPEAPLPHLSPDTDTAFRSEATETEGAYGREPAEDASWWCGGTAYG